MTIHNDLAQYYQVAYNMSKFHNFSITEIENMYPFERDVYYELILAQLKEEADQQKLQAKAQGHTPMKVEFPKF